MRSYTYAYVVGLGNLVADVRLPERNELLYYIISKPKNIHNRYFNKNCTRFGKVRLGSQRQCIHRKMPVCNGKCCRRYHQRRSVLQTCTDSAGRLTC